MRGIGKGLSGVGVGLAVVALAAAPAQAKGDVSVVAPRAVAVGKVFKVSAHGDDDAARYLRICLQERSGKAAWRQAGCGGVVRRGGPEGRVAVQVKVARRGAVQFRAVMYGLKGLKDRHPVRWRISETVSVRVR